MTDDFDYQKTGSMDQGISDTDGYMGRRATTEEVGNKFAKRAVAVMMVIPLLVICSPVLVAAIFTAFPLATVFLASGVVSVTVARVMEWLSRNVTGGANLSQPNQSVERKAAGRPFDDMVYDHVTGHESLDKVLSLLMHVAKESFINSVGGVYGKVFRWIYKYVKGEHPTGADTSGRATRKFGSIVGEMSDQNTYGGGNHVLVKAAAGGSLVFLSALTFTGTVITSAMAAPVFVIFSPVLVPALITMFLLAIGFLSSAMFGVAGVSVLTWLYKYKSGGNPVGAELLDQVFQRFGYKAREMQGERERAIGGGHPYTSGLDFYKMMKAGTATTAGISLLILSGLTFAGTVIGLTLVTPLLVIFSPVLVPALISVLVLGGGFLTAGVFGVAGAVVLAWMYKYATGANSLDIERSGTSEHTIREGHTATEDGGQKFIRSVVALLVASPLLLILSPLLVPMMIAILMLGTLCLAAGTFSAAATRMFEWAYNSVTGGRQSRTNSMDERTHKLRLSDPEMRERGEQKIEGGHNTAAVGGGLSMT